MTGTGSTNPSSSTNQKPYNMTNIKTLVPLILDLNQLNYDVWLGFFVLNHITYSSKPSSDTDEDWLPLDVVVKTCIYGILTHLLLNIILKPGATANSAWVNLEIKLVKINVLALFEIDNELHAMTVSDQTIVQYCKKMTTYSNLLANLQNPVSEQKLVTHLLNGLSP